MLGHRFWRYMRPKRFKAQSSEAEIAALGDRIPAYYIHMDRVLGQLIAIVPDRAVGQEILGDPGSMGWRGQAVEIEELIARLPAEASDVHHFEAIGAPARRGNPVPRGARVRRRAPGARAPCDRSAGRG